MRELNRAALTVTLAAGAILGVACSSGASTVEAGVPASSEAAATRIPAESSVDAWSPMAPGSGIVATWLPDEYGPMTLVSARDDVVRYGLGEPNDDQVIMIAWPPGYDPSSLPSFDDMPSLPNAEVVDINGREGVVIAWQPDGDGEASLLFWEAAPGTIAQAVAFAPFDTHLVDVARSTKVVPAEEFDQIISELDN